MRVKFNLILILCTLVWINGCAYMDAHLNIGYDPAKSSRGSIASVDSLNVNVGEFTDTRSDRAIGHKINGYGSETAVVMSREPMSEVMRNAFVMMLEHNGHIINNKEPQLIFVGEVKSFAIQNRSHLMTVEFIGDATIRLNVMAPNKKIIYTREYSEEYGEHKAIGTMKFWEEIMNATLDKLMDQVASDSRLVEVFEDQKTEPKSA